MDRIIFIHGLLGSKHNFEYMENEFSEYNTESIELIGFGEEKKPHINYDINDFVLFLEQRLELNRKTSTQYILVGHSMGALLAKELAIKYPDNINKVFLISYPFYNKDVVMQKYNYFDRKYAEGVWWTKIACQTEIIYKWLFYPYFYLFRYKYRRSYMDFFKHSYQSAHGAIRNTIFEDKKEKLFDIHNKVFLISGENDNSVDFNFSKNFNHFTIDNMDHIFFGYESLISELIKSRI